MWDDVGILRDRPGLIRARQKLDTLAKETLDCGLSGGTRVFNLTWHDRMNLENQILVSKVITETALAREDSRGAHYRSDYPDSGSLEETRYTVARLEDEQIEVTSEAVEFSYVRPGETLIREDLQAGTRGDVA